MRQRCRQEKHVKKEFELIVQNQWNETHYVVLCVFYYIILVILGSALAHEVYGSGGGLD